MHRSTIIILTITAALLSAPLHADEPKNNGVKLGIMKCQSVPGTAESKIVSSSVKVNCQMTYSNGKQEAYTGETGVKAGIDLSRNRNKTLMFTVIASSQLEPAAGMMAGEFQGAKAAVTADIGAGANVLVGGIGDKLTLSPMAPEGSTGLGIAAGMAYMKLQPAE